MNKLHLDMISVKLFGLLIIINVVKMSRFEKCS